MTAGGAALVAWIRSDERLGAASEGPRHLLDRRGWRTLRCDPTGLLVATAFALLAMTPSILPRDWAFQGVVSGISAAAGYGVGTALAWVVRRTPVQAQAAHWVRRVVPAAVRRCAWAGLLVAVPVALLVGLVVAADWQHDVRPLVGLPEQHSAGTLRSAPLIVVLAALIVALFRALRLLARKLAELLRRRFPVPAWVAQGIAAVVVALVTVGLLDGVVLRWALSAADTSFSVANEQTPDGVEQPRSPTRSGSPSSLSAWDTLGTYGQEFVAGGPSSDEIATAAGLSADAVPEPIRVYVGIEGRDTPAARAELAVAELERTGAAERDVVCVIVTTGTGWIDSAAPRALELMYGGHTAVVGTQYSYLPSWLSFLFDRDRVVQEGRALIDAVADWVDAMPVADRPRLLVYGTSLGTMGGESAFDGLADIRARTDGVLWTGPPQGNELRRTLIERRDPGTREVAPVYADGLVVRFGNSPEDLLEPDNDWLQPRTAYLMHPSDPVVWWSWDLLFRRPDWLEEPRGEGVSPAMSWYPVITFWQVSADLTNAASPPMGYGHNYGAQLVDAWAIVAPPSGWTAADTERARAVFLD
ncbi:Uncharacterized membrane protein [Blastococcus aurantiacus]|uniref:Uncharacterized membrane protein n=1 Tax=Blastococcus aurantiacus TaxID=1550231 RepID=A0A1G7NFL7_9ACTN|nr:alpha/beta-hydrolase family protein [Blastococcus aurantiacus]SDF72844.1 Uncharacterized membrane protein [Blastococcus aurantiacus]